MILDFDYITMGQRIKQRRKELNMTQAECGSQHLSFELFVSICNTLSINPDYLINGCTHLSNTPLQVMDNLTLCDDTSVELTRRFTELLVELYPNKSNQK